MKHHEFAALLPAVLGLTLIVAAPAQSSRDPRLVRGKEVFLTYCAGCHGFSGFAFFPYAPSFSMGDRMEKSDADLLQTILKGKNEMPSWEDKLPLSWLTDALRYLRHMNKLSLGNHPVENDPPEIFYIFPAYGGQERHDWPVPPD